MKTLILGIGNLLMGDEGVGIHAANYIEQQFQLPDDVDALDGGSGGLHLLDYFHQYPRVILIDATMDGQPVGTIAQLTPKFSSDYPPTLTAHDIGLKDVLDVLFLMDNQPEIILFTITIEDMSTMATEMTPAVAAAVPAVAKALMQFINDTK